MVRHALISESNIHCFANVNFDVVTSVLVWLRFQEHNMMLIDIVMFFQQDLTTIVSALGPQGLDLLKVSSQSVSNSDVLLCN